MIAASDRITLIPGNYADSLAFRATSALEHCTRVDSSPDGTLYTERNWPGLSSGEELLWRCLAWVNGAGGDLPSPDDLRAGLDETNCAAAFKLLASFGVTA